MKLRFFSSLQLIFLLISSLTLIHLVHLARSASRTWTVDDDGAADFNMIQEAINAASHGDTISVSAGTYHENVVVNKTVSFIGESKTTTIIEAVQGGDTLVIRSDNVAVTGFTIQGSENYGMYLVSAKNCHIYGNIIRDNHYALFSKWCSGALIENNTVIENTIGTQINDSTDFTLRSNNITENKYNFGVWGQPLSTFIHNIDTSNKVDGKPIYYMVNQQNLIVPSDAGFVGVVNSSNITVKNLTLTKNSEGLLFAFSNESQIRDVSIAANAYGVELYQGNGNTVTNSKITGNEHGVLLFYSENNTVSLNVLTNNSYGVDLQQSDDNAIIKNLVQNCSSGISVSGGRNNFISENVVKNIRSGRAVWLSGANTTVVRNTIKSSDLGLSIQGATSTSFMVYHNNFISNTEQVQLLNEPSIVWDNGYPSGGNYWSDYNGTDADGDGIGDTPYIIDTENIDRYPLANQYLTDVIPPVVSVLSPVNKTYQTENIPLTLRTSEQTSWIGYNLDERLNVTIVSNTTLHGLSEGPHRLTVFVQDIVGNNGTPQTVFFTVKANQTGDLMRYLPLAAAIIAAIFTIALLTYFLKVKKRPQNSKQS